MESPRVAHDRGRAWLHCSRLSSTLHAPACALEVAPDHFGGPRTNQWDLSSTRPNVSPIALLNTGRPAQRSAPGAELALCRPEATPEIEAYLAGKGLFRLLGARRVLGARTQTRIRTVAAKEAKERSLDERNLGPVSGAEQVSLFEFFPDRDSVSNVRER
ncbi:hypothetical protein NDU88_005445 [Pleurodeles waltl]|uniref:Uncharacterized protein n=1 Tax=Pleurodeles waltl TaxID=8319 RepID=A0AAV7MWB0_PLEWA|nr:hypothetical protein NDU88_005445 [Pleurodeles waltl]